MASTLICVFFFLFAIPYLCLGQIPVGDKVISYQRQPMPLIQNVVQMNVIENDLFFLTLDSINNGSEWHSLWLQKSVNLHGWSLEKLAKGPIRAYDVAQDGSWFAVSVDSVGEGGRIALWRRANDTGNSTVEAGTAPGYKPWLIFNTTQVSTSVKFSPDANVFLYWMPYASNNTKNLNGTYKLLTFNGTRNNWTVNSQVKATPPVSATIQHISNGALWFLVGKYALYRKTDAKFDYAFYPLSNLNLTEGVNWTLQLNDDRLIATGAPANSSDARPIQLYNRASNHWTLAGEDSIESSGSDVLFYAPQVANNGQLLLWGALNTDEGYSYVNVFKLNSSAQHYDFLGSIFPYGVDDVDQLRLFGNTAVAAGGGYFVTGLNVPLQLINLGAIVNTSEVAPPSAVISSVSYTQATFSWSAPFAQGEPLDAFVTTINTFTNLSEEIAPQSFQTDITPSSFGPWYLTTCLNHTTEDSDETYNVTFQTLQQNTSSSLSSLHFTPPSQAPLASIVWNDCLFANKQSVCTNVGNFSVGSSMTYTASNTFFNITNNGTAICIRSMVVDYNRTRVFSGLLCNTTSITYPYLFMSNGLHRYASISVSTYNLSIATGCSLPDHHGQGVLSSSTTATTATSSGSDSDGLGTIVTTITTATSAISTATSTTGSTSNTTGGTSGSTSGHGKSIFEKWGIEIIAAPVIVVVIIGTVIAYFFLKHRRPSNEYEPVMTSD